MSNINSAKTIRLVANDSQSSTKKKPFSLKVVLLGDFGVGKTAFAIKLCENRFNPEIPLTIGADMFLKDLNLHQKVEARVQVWDTAGQERYRALSERHVRSADGLIIFYDVTNKDSFQGIHTWIRFIEDGLGNEPYVLMLVGAKVDMNDRKVEKEEGQKLAKELNALHFEVSAKTGENVEESFATLAEELHKKNVEKYKGEVLQMEETEKKSETSSCCKK